MRNRLLPGGITILALLLTAGCGKPKSSEHEDHKGHSEAEHANKAKESHESHAEEEAGAHEGEAPDAHAGEAHDAHEGEGEIEVSPEGIKMAGITLSKAGTGTIKAYIDLAGEVGFNEDRLAHITPRFSGIAKEARFKVGDYVNTGDVVAVIESNENLAEYSLKAPISGSVIEKHILPGEHVSESESVYILADLSTVWVNLAVYPKDAAIVKPGRKVSIFTVGSSNVAQGTIQYVTPVMDPQTRRITARVVLPNGQNDWRPGTFVNAHVEAGEGREGLVIEKNAVQMLDGKPVVFVSDEPNRFMPVEVTTGESDSQRVYILGGLESGMEYVNNGAFELKAKIVTSSLGSHAGHGH
jgi:cobalt-zinc-cadmium efflux system membrane fusion protein